MARFSVTLLSLECHYCPIFLSSRCLSDGVEGCVPSSDINYSQHTGYNSMPVTCLLILLDSRLCSTSFLGYLPSDLLVQHLPSAVACFHKDGALFLVRALVSPAIRCYCGSHHSSRVALS